MAAVRDVADRIQFADAIRPARAAPMQHVTSRRRPRWAGLAAFALLGIYAAMAWTASLGKGQSFDEGLQLAVGYNIWLNEDFRMEGANGDFVKRWATLPFLVTRPKFVQRDDRFWKLGAPYELAHRFFFQIGNRPESLLQQARAMIVVLGITTGLIVLFWSRALFGTAGGLLSLGLFAFSPHMLAFGAVVSTDMSITLLLFTATGCIWRLLHGVTWPRLLLSLGVFALLVLAKPSALVILPITAVLVGIKLLRGDAVVVRHAGFARILRKRRHQATVFALVACLHAVAAFGAIWSHYSFRHKASPDPADPSIQFSRLQYHDSMSVPLKRTLEWLRTSGVVPEGFYHGVHQLAGNDDEIVSFLDGEWTIGGRPDFFPYAIWVKSPPALFVLLAAAAVTVIWARRRVRRIARQAEDEPLHLPSWYVMSPLLVLIGCYLTIAIAEDLNIGHRHVLPIYPALYVLAGASGLALGGLTQRGKGLALAVALTWPAVESFATRPDYLAYFGPQAGGTEEGYRRLVDSSLDWGMDLPALREWLDRHDPSRSTKVFLAYFGTDSPTYHGINARRLPGFFDRRPFDAYALEPGYYAISATLLQSVYTAAFGPWSKAYEARYRQALHYIQKLENILADPRRRGEWQHALTSERSRDEVAAFDALRFGRLCAWLRHRRPPLARAGQSILIWNLSYEELREATFGPPVELTDDPLPKRNYGRKAPVWN